MPHRIDIPDWALKRARSMNVFSSVDPAQTAVVVVDLQNGFLDAGTPAAVEFGLPILPNVNRVIAAARAAGSQVVFLRQTFSEEPGHDLAPWQKDVSPGIARLRSVLRPGRIEHEVHAGLDRQAGDMVVDKFRHSAFNRHGSDLDDRLRAAGIDTLVITGAMTNVCCESTARDAYALGYRVFFLSDATAALTDEEHNAALLNLSMCFADVRDTDSMVALFDEARAPA
jgi:nicotinamidase-related amidase